MVLRLRLVSPSDHPFERLLVEWAEKRAGEEEEEPRRTRMREGRCELREGVAGWSRSRRRRGWKGRKELDGGGGGMQTRS